MLLIIKDQMYFFVLNSAAYTADPSLMSMYLYIPDELLSMLGAGAFGKVVDCIDRDK